MRSLVSVCAMLMLVAAAFAADQPLASWDFSQAGDIAKWEPTHSLTPFVGTGEALQTKATDGDPYMIVASARAFEIEANDFQYVEIKLKSDKNGGGEFFWANTTEGRDQGFVAGQEIGFSVKGDGAFHVYRVFPGWEGHLSRLRFDPPEGAAIEIASLRIMQAPPSKHDPASHRWDFRAEGAGGFVPTSGCTYEPGSAGLKVVLDDTDGLLTGPALNWQATDGHWLTLHLTAAAPLELACKWATGPEGRLASSNLLAAKLTPGEQYLTFDLSEHPNWSGAVSRLGLVLTGQPGDTVTLHELAVAAQPEGPARLRMLSCATTRALVAAGETAELLLRYRNEGSVAATGLRATVKATGTTGSLALPAATAVPEVAPGGVAELRLKVPTLKAGRPTLEAEVTGAGLFSTARASTSLIVTAPAPVLPAGTGVFAKVLNGAAVVANENLRLVFLSTGEPGFGAARVELREGKGYRVLGSLPALARLAVEADTEAVPVPLTVATSGVRDGAAWVTLKGRRAGLAVEVTYRLASQRSWADLSYRLSATDGKPHALKAFQGPWLWAGEGGFGAEQDRALFPGVEWLVKGERSSSTLDIAPPRNVRWAPHPNWITVPSMAVQQGGAVIGLLWDASQKWDGAQIRPGAVFASPNFIEDRGNHLLGLFLPSIPDYVEPNTLLAKQAYDLKPGKVLTLQASLLARARSEVTDAVMAWYERFPGKTLAPDLPPMPRSYEATVDMSLRAYEKVLWDSKAGGWMPVLGWKPGRDVGVAQMYQTAALVRRGQPEAAAWQAKALEVARGSSDLTFALRVNGNVPGALRAVVAGGQTAAAAQPEGARYAFHPDEKRAVLGKDGETAVGIGASAVEHLLDTALRTGDPVAREAGLKGLGFLDQFDVPRAAQVWECPLHSPDILASGQACRAYLRGYRLTGEERYLRQASYWARTGLPFVYAWQAPEMPKLMKYASIPIFGATYFTGSWFGVPVQWNGLDYAGACLELAPYDKTFPWRQVGEGITISGMNQQSVRAKDYGCYTDNWNMVTDVECTGCMLAPGGILRNVFRLMGTPSSAGVDGVRTTTGWIAVNGPGAVTGAALDKDTLSADLSYFAGESAGAAVLPVTKPATVSVDGKALEFVALGQPAEGQWTYDKGLACVTLKTKFGARPGHLVLTGVQRRELAINQSEWLFTEPGDTQGWMAAHDLTELTVADGVLKTRVTGGDPYLVGPACGVAASQVRGIAVRLRAAKTAGQFFWATDAGSLAPERSVGFTVPADGQFHEVTVDLSSHPGWRGIIRQVRLDPPGEAGDTVEVQWVKLVKR